MPSLSIEVRSISPAPLLAASFAHAISTHRVSNEVEFFTALDDLQEEPGSAHMGSLEFNSATYYRYVSLDLGQLAHSLGIAHSGNTDDLKKAIAAFTQALFVAVPKLTASAPIFVPVAALIAIVVARLMYKKGWL